MRKQLNFLENVVYHNRTPISAAWTHGVMRYKDRICTYDSCVTCEKSPWAALSWSFFLPRGYILLVKFLGADIWKILSRHTSYPNEPRAVVEATDILLAAGTMRAKKKNPSSRERKSINFDINPGNWKCLIFTILPVNYDKIWITKDGWPWD